MREDRMLTINEAAARLRLNRETVRRWLSTGKLRGHKLGPTRGGWRIPESALQEYLDATANQPHPEE